MTVQKSKPMTMSGIAKLANVSRTAVSTVLNNRRSTTRLNPETRHRIEAVLKKTNYRPNTVGKALVTGRSLVIGVVLREVGESFVPESLQGIEDFAEDRGYGALVMTTRGRASREDQVLEFLLERRVDGLILGPLLGPSPAVAKAIIARQIPVSYVFQNPADPLPNSRYVWTDGAQVGYLAGRHLLEKGHQYIVSVAASTDICAGLAKAQAEFQPDARIEHWEWSPPLARVEEEYLERWRTMSPRPSAMFFFGDIRACRFMNLAIRGGVRIPEDLAIMGVDDLPMAQESIVPLTTIRQAKYEQGKEACRILFELMEGRSPENTVFQPELVPRQST